MNATTTTLPVAGEQFGQYTIERKLGEGGVATVYSSRGANGVQIALKVLKPEAEQHADVRDSFQREQQLGSRFSHPNVVSVLDGGAVHGQHYLTMPVAAGGSLEDRLRGGKRLLPTTAITIARQIAWGLHHVHAQGIVHRDLKPANILLEGNLPQPSADLAALERQIRARLCDFGLAVEIESADAVSGERLWGTPLYSAPEQIETGARVDGRTDLYGLGVVLYRMVTGRAPFYGSRSEVLHAHLATKPPAPSKFARITPELEAIILKTLAKDPADRFQTGVEFSMALADCTACRILQGRFAALRHMLWSSQLQAT